MTRTPENLLEFTVDALDRLRTAPPVVQCITNSVVTNFTANALLALGAAPAMADLPVEAAEFARIASGVLVNLGTPHADQREGARQAIVAAQEVGTPWVLDPVAVGGLSVRTAFALEILEHRPAVVRGNASEVMAVAQVGAGGRGVDSTDSVDAALAAARSLAERTGGAVAVSGPIDAITDGESVIRIANGTPLLTRVTGGGCALGAVVAAFASLDGDRLATTVAAVTTYTVAAEIAAERASGPGGFGVAFLDALAEIDGPTLAARANIS